MLNQALARAFRRRRMLETGAIATVREIVAKEKINASYVSPVPPLRLPAPEMTLPVPMKTLAVEWEQRRG